jgi:hypothetical protein
MIQPAAVFEAPAQGAFRTARGEACFAEAAGA